MLLVTNTLLTLERNGLDFKNFSVSVTHLLVLKIFTVNSIYNDHHNPVQSPTIVQCSVYNMPFVTSVHCLQASGY